MARLINNQFIFIHSAKTGGTFFREVLNRFGIPNYEVGDKHSKWTEFIDYPQPMFGFVREPISWYRSRWAYAMLTQFGHQLAYNEGAKAHWMAPVWSEDLNVFVERTLQRYQDGVATEYFDRMLNILSKYNNQVIIHRMEDMTAVIVHYMKLFGKEDVTAEDIRQIPKENVSIADHKYPYAAFKNDFGKFKKDQIAPSLQAEIKVVESKIYKLYYNEQV